MFFILNRLILYLKMHDANSSSEKIMKSLENDYSLPLFKHRNFINAPNNLSTQYGVINSSIAFSLYHLIKLNIYNTYNNNGNNIKINNYIDINHNIRKIIANDISEILFREYNMSVQNKNNIETKLFNSSKFFFSIPSTTKCIIQFLKSSRNVITTRTLHFLSIFV